MLNFIIIGCQKAGTTMLKHNLTKINQISMPKQEIHFFNNNYEKGILWYENKFSKRNDNKHVIYGEKTPNYITDIEYLRRIYKHYPNVKLIISMRNPIFRALSHWNHFNQIYPKSLKWGWVYNNTITDSIKNNKSILSNGEYYKQLLDVYNIFPKEQVHIIINEQLRNDTHNEFNNLCKFLNITNTLTDYSNVHERKYQHEVNVSEIKYLIEYYQKQLENLYDLLGYRIPEWDNFINAYSSDYSYVNLPISVKNDHKVNCIITCVNYSDFLSITLPENIKTINNILVLTVPNDIKTINICKKYNVNYIATDIFYQKQKNTNILKSIIRKLCCYHCVCQGHCQYKCFKNRNTVFQKSKAINLGIRSFPENSWILLLDADIIVPNKFKDTNLSILDKNTLYGTSRIIYKSQHDWLLKKNSKFDFWKFMGFFQLFNTESANFHKKYFGYNEKYNYANGGDYYFSKKWPIKKLLDFYVVHLGETGENWEGRITDFWK